MRKENKKYRDTKAKIFAFPSTRSANRKVSRDKRFVVRDAGTLKVKACQIPKGKNPKPPKK